MWLGEGSCSGGAMQALFEVVALDDVVDEVVDEVGV